VSTSNGVSGVLTNINNAFSGKTSGIDVASTVDALMQLKRAPETQWRNEQLAVTARISTLGMIASDLTQLQTAVNDLKDSFGALGQKTVTSSNTSIVSATAHTSAVTGTHSIIVAQLATTSSAYSDPITDPTTLAGTSLSIAYGDADNPAKTDSISLPATVKTLQDVADAINQSAQNTGVKASVVTDATGQRLALVSKTSGEGGNLTVTGGVSFHQGVEGKDALGSVDGVPFDSAANTLTGVLTGVDLQLSGADKNTVVQIGIEPDTTEAATAVNNFITSYNAVMNDVNSQFTSDSSGNAGPLAGDAALRTLQSQLLEIAGYSPGKSGAYVNLQHLGIEMNNDGTLEMNSTALDDVLTNHYSDFQNFFQSTDKGSFGQTVGSMLLQITDPTQGTVSADITAEQAIGKSLTQQISDFEDHMAAVQQQLTSQYSLLNVLLQQYPSQMSEISSQLSALNPSSKS